MTDNERAARLAGWLPGQDYGPPPDYENSIDAQMRDLDPLVEAKLGDMNEQVNHYPDCTPAVIVYLFARNKIGVTGTGPTRASARLRALLAALEATT